MTDKNENSTSGEEPIPWRPSIPAGVTQAAGATVAVLGFVLLLWAATWDIWTNPGEGPGAGLATAAAVFTAAIAAVLVLGGGSLVVYGRSAARRGTVRGPAILSGLALGVVGAVSASAISAADGGPVTVNYWNLAPLVLGPVAGWRWGVVIRRRNDVPDQGASDDATSPDPGAPQPGATETAADGDSEATVQSATEEGDPAKRGLLYGATVAVGGLALSLAVPSLGVVLFAVGLAVAIGVPGWYWAVRPAYRRFAEG